ncbi:MAG: LPS assembly protein LptD [Phycisphaeraceae bacterium]|nr:LPS assembly protein LptD [Phycisphaeraceae bacterium]
MPVSEPTAQRVALPPRRRLSGLARRWRRITRIALFSASLIIAAGHLPAHRAILAQEPAPAPRTAIEPAAAASPTTGQPLRQPLIRADTRIEGQRVQAWSDPDQGTQYLLVDGDVRLNIGLYRLRGARMVVRIQPKDAQVGVGRYQIAAFIQDARSHANAQTQTRIESDRLLVTALTEGRLQLASDILDYRSAVAHPLSIEAAERFEEFDRVLASPTLPVPTVDLFGPEVERLRDARRAEVAAELRDLARQRIVERPVEPAPERDPPPEPPEGPEPPAVLPPELPPPEVPEVEPVEPPIEERPSPFERILPAEGQVSFAARRVIVDGQRRAIVLMGDVAVVYHGVPGETGRSLQADRAVIFLDEDAGAVGRAIDASIVTGIYLEDNVVATDGQFTARAPRVFYDPSRNQAMMLDAVIFSRDVASQDRDAPLYLRARQVHQESQRRFTALDATLTTTDFARPHLALGATRLTLEQRIDSREREVNYVDARRVRLEAGGLPFFYLPRISGEIPDYPLRGVGMDLTSRRGPVVTTAWDTFALVGRPRPEGVDSELNIDWQGRHNIGLGTWIEYDQPNLHGRLEGYIVPWDTGPDLIDDRAAIDFDGRVRGMTRFLHQQAFTEENLVLEAELSYVSDPTFLEEFRRAQAETDAPWTTRVRIKQQGEDAAATLALGYTLTDFTPQTYALQAPGYVVDRHVELGYRMIGVSFWDDRLTYYGQTRAGYMRMIAGNDTPERRGFSDAQSQMIFGVDRDVRFRDRMRDMGLPDDARMRVDTRHEVRMPLDLGDWRLTPYAVGSATAYDNDFEAYRGMGDPYRVHGAVGVSLTGELARDWPGITLPLLDVRGMRHIVQPFADVSFGIGTSSAGKLPVFDRDVEGIEDGWIVRSGARQIFQTQRGGPGEWRTVDWLTVHSEIVLRQKSINPNDPLPHFFETRPELSTGGDHVRGELLWMLTDALALRAEGLYSLESGKVELWKVGTSFDTRARMRLHVGYAEIDSLRERRLTWGADYQITDIYRIEFHQSYDFGPRGSRTYGVELARQAPQWRLLVGGYYDETSGDFSISVSVSPDLNF